MQTEKHTRGDTLPLVVTLRQTDGTPYDLSDCAVALHIQNGALCIEVAGTIPDPLLGAVLFDLAPLDLSPRVRRATVEVTWSGGATETAGEFALNIVEGC